MRFKADFHFRTLNYMTKKNRVGFLQKQSYDKFQVKKFKHTFSMINLQTKNTRGGLHQGRKLN